jgi:hypothetical protein
MLTIYENPRLSVHIFQLDKDSTGEDLMRMEHEPLHWICRR